MGLIFHQILCMSFLKKIFLMLYSVVFLTIVHCLTVFTSWDIGLWRFARFGTICNNLKKREKYPLKVLLSVKLLADVCILTKRNTPPWVSFTLFKLYKWYQIAQRTTYVHYVVISFPLNNVIKLTTLKPLKVACRVRVTYFKE